MSLFSINTAEPTSSSHLSIRIYGLLAAAFCAASLSWVAPSHAQSIEELKAKGASIAIAPEPPLMTIDENGVPGGLGPEMDRAILDEIGITAVTGQVMEYGAIIPAVQSRRVTMGTSAALYVRPERCRAVNFSEPMSCSQEAFILPTSLVDKVKSYKDVAEQGLRIGVCGGCSEQKLATDAGVDASKITVFPDGVSGYKLLADNRIDVFAHDSVTATGVQRRVGDGKTAVVIAEGTAVSCAAAAFNKDDKELLDAYNKARLNLFKSGKYMEILKKYDLEAVSVADLDVTTEKLCNP